MDIYYAPQSNDYGYYVIVKIKLHCMDNLRSDLKPACCFLHFGVQEVIFYAKIYFYLKQTCSGLCKQTLLNQNAVLSKRSATAQQSEEGAQKSAILVGDSNLGGRGAQPTCYSCNPMSFFSLQLSRCSTATFSWLREYWLLEELNSGLLLGTLKWRIERSHSQGQYN